MANHIPSRRNFLKQLGLGAVLAVPAAITFGRMFPAQAAEAAKKLEMVDPKSPQAVSLGYHVDAKKVDTKKWPKRAGAEGAKQFCHNCQFYQTAQGSEAQAPCQIFMNKGVKGEGWCNTWTKKA